MRWLRLRTILGSPPKHTDVLKLELRLYLLIATYEAHNVIVAVVVDEFP